MPTTPTNPTQMDNLIDQEITNQTALRSITPNKLGTLLKTMIAFIVSFFVSKSEKGEANGVASLDENGKVPDTQLPAMGGGSIIAEGDESMKISAMEIIEQLDGTEIVPVVQNGVNKSIELIKLMDLLKDLLEPTASGSSSGGGALSNIINDFISMVFSTQDLTLSIDKEVNGNNEIEFVFSLRYKNENDQVVISEIFRCAAGATPNIDGNFPIDGNANVPEFFKDKIFAIPNQYGVAVYDIRNGQYYILGSEHISITNGNMIIRNPNDWNDVLYAHTDQLNLPDIKKIALYSFNQSILDNPPKLSVDIWDNNVGQFVQLNFFTLNEPMGNGQNAVKKLLMYTRAIPNYSDNQPQIMGNNCTFRISDSTTNNYVIVNVLDWQTQYHIITSMG